MSLLDAKHLWDGHALSRRHIAVAISQEGIVDAENPLVAGVAGGDWVTVYPKDLSVFLQLHSSCRVICHDAALLHWGLYRYFCQHDQPEGASALFMLSAGYQLWDIMLWHQRLWYAETGRDSRPRPLDDLIREYNRGQTATYSDTAATLSAIVNITKSLLILLRRIDIA